MDIRLMIFYGIGIATTLGIGSGVYWRSAKSRKLVPLWLLIGLIGLSAYLFFAQYFKYQSLNMYTDLAHWLQILWNITATGLPISMGAEFQIAGTANYLSAHFVPLIYMLAIPFKMIPRPETLLTLNVALMLSAAVPLYKLALHMRKVKRFALLVAALLLWYPTFQYITLYEFEMLRFSIPILLWMVYFFETRRTILYLLFVVLAILVREEMGLTVAMFGLYAWIFQKRWREGIAAIVLGFGGFALITSVMMPALRSGEYIHVAAGVFSQFGSTPLEILKGAVTHPLLVVQAVLNPVKLANLFMLGLPLIFVPLSAPSALLSSLASIGTGLLSNSFAHSSYMLYYIAPSIPFIFYAFLKAWPKVIARVNEKAATNALVAAVLVSNIFFGPSPISLQFWFKNIQPAPFRTQNFHWSVYRANDHYRKVEEFVRLIPDDAIVSTQEFLMPRLYKKKGTLVFPALRSKDGKWKAEYVFLDTTENGLKLESPAFVTAEEMALVRQNDEWERIAQEDGYELYYQRKL